MLTTETILSRMMNDPAFAEALLANPAGALAEYDLSPEQLVQFQELSQVEIDAMAANPEDRKSFSLWGTGKRVSIDFCKTD